MQSVAKWSSKPHVRCRHIWHTAVNTVPPAACVIGLNAYVQNGS